MSATMQSIDWLAIGAAVALMVEIEKSLFRSPAQARRFGPYLVLVSSLLVTVAYAVSAPSFPPDRTDVWALLLGWLNTTATAIGVYHGTKTASRLVPRDEVKPPPVPRSTVGKG